MPKYRQRKNKAKKQKRLKVVETNNLRAIAAQVVHQVSYDQKSLNGLMAPALIKVPDNDKALLQELCFGVCRWYDKLKTIQRSLMVRPLDPEDKVIETLILVGIYQLLEMRVPSHAAIYETVEAASALGFDRLKGMVNGVLRNVEREEESWLEKLEDNEQFIYSHPQWMIEKLRNNWPDHWQDILHNNNQRPPMILRVNLAKESRQGYLEKLSEAGIKATASVHAAAGILLDAPVDVEALPGFGDGSVSVQDEAAQLCCELLDPPPKARILDTCAAPGGKTCAILERFPDAEVTAIDIDEERVARIHQNLQRLELSANVITGDAADPDAWWDGALFDRILLDAPCSAMGVIRRHPDIKQLRMENDIVPLAKLQLGILQASWKMLKPDGKLIYATCSVFSQENSRIIERFVSNQSDAELIVIDKVWGKATPFGEQLFPQNKGHDGFFYACLKKSD